VTVIAATNRPDIVDPAILRPGRFDRLVLVPVPDADARRSILDIHTRDMPLADDFDPDTIVKRTEGFVGADIESLCREAALNALREDEEVEKVEMRQFEAALEKVKASVDMDIMRHYAEMSRKLEKVQLDFESLGPYR
jgi:transitional endoplasmic reticulum ATPase